MSNPQRNSEVKAGTADDSRPVAAPSQRYDPDWRERIEIAKQARDQARKARGNKPVTFPPGRRPI